MTSPIKEHTKEHIEKIMSLGDYVNNSDAREKIGIMLECERQNAKDEILNEVQIYLNKWTEDEEYSNGQLVTDLEDLIKNRKVKR